MPNVFRSLEQAKESELDLGMAGIAVLPFRTRAEGFAQQVDVSYDGFQQ